MAPPISSSENSRPHLLYNFRAVFVAVAHIAFHRTEQLNNSLGLVARVLAFFAGPILQPVERHWLSMLSSFDGCILAVEDVAVSLFPQVDKLVLALDQLAVLVEQLPKLVDVAIEHLPSSKPVVKTTAHDWEWSPEKDIAVDVKCEEEEKAAAEAMKGGGDREEEIKEVEEPTTQVGKGSEKKVGEEEEELKDPILELFDAGWGWK